jgi:biotin carboxyl carrier protein
VSIEPLIAYFHRSRFDYLALDFAGSSLRLSRDGAASNVQRGSARDIVAPSVGFVEAATGRDQFPRMGMPVAEGEPLFRLRRFTDTIEVRAPTGGTLEALLVEQGTFVEYGERIAVLRAA